MVRAERNSPLARQRRVLVAGEDPGRLELLASVASGLGEDVVAREVELGEIAEATRETRPDVALVGLHDHHTAHALELIALLVKEEICPVVAVLDGENSDFVDSAAAGGIFAYVTSLDRDALKGAMVVATLRYNEAAALEGALQRRAVIERAKGVLMERHGIDETAAFELLRDHARRSGQKVLHVSDGLLRSHPLHRPPSVAEE